ncbi:MAG: aspartate/tyrosine/aromatic aminotransferase [Chlamydiae bacterium]|nr:aspartate/tyrosine/aromatic aminotransferase [Chlamydiota bacterium]
MTTSFFENLHPKPADPIFGLTAEFKADPRKEKVNLIIGVYAEEDGSSPRVLDVVKEAEKKLIEKEITKDYLGIDGDNSFSEAVFRLVLGDDLYEQNVDRLYAAQTPGGAAALRVIIEFLHKNISKAIALSDPTWANHVTMSNYLGIEVLHYPYYDRVNHTVRFDACIDFISSLEPSTVVLLQASAHNPTGIDFTMDQWKELAKVIKKKKLIPLFDIAYQGFAEGLEQDVASVRHFVEEGIECFIAYSCSKNFAIYSERVGAIFFVGKDAAVKDKVASHIKASIRANYSNPPRHGSSVVSMILRSPELKKKWEEELRVMARRIEEKRSLLADRLGSDYQFFKKAKGFFSLFSITPEEALVLKKEYALYVTSMGRLNMAGVNKNNIERIVHSVAQVSR